MSKEKTEFPKQEIPEIKDGQGEIEHPPIQDPVKKNEKGSRRFMIWTIIIVLVLLFGMMITENSDKEPPNQVETEMYQIQAGEDSVSKAIPGITSPNGMYSEEEVGPAEGEHVMDKAWRGSDTNVADPSVSTEELDTFQEKIMPPDNK